MFLFEIFNNSNIIIYICRIYYNFTSVGNYKILFECGRMISIMKKNYFGKISVIAAVLSLFLAGCSKSGKIESISENELFSIPYGSFEEQISTIDLNKVGDVRYGISMRDGFFYIVDGEAKKIMETNSYGDLLTLFYNDDSEIKNLLDKSDSEDLSIHREISYPFDYPGMITVDSKKVIYAACIIPRNRQEQGDGEVLLSQTVLRFARDGSYVDYLGQQGPGGTPFPYIKNIYTTSKDELVVVCLVNDGMEVFWFGTDGFLKYMIPVTSDSIPVLENRKSTNEIFFTIENLIPDPNDYKLYVKVDYYQTYIDEDSHVQSGIDYLQTMLYPFDIEKSVFEAAVSVPPYEQSVVADYSRLTYKIPYDFLGVTTNGWKFFIVKTNEGFNIEMLQTDNQRLLRRNFVVDHNDLLHDSMTLSLDGIITALYIKKDSAKVVWYRTDNLIESIVKN